MKRVYKEFGFDKRIDFELKNLNKFYKGKIYVNHNIY